MGHVPRGSDDRIVASLTFIKHTRLNILACVCVIEPLYALLQILQPEAQCWSEGSLLCCFRAARTGGGEMQSEVSRVCFFPVLEVHSDDLIMIDC